MAISAPVQCDNFFDPLNLMSYAMARLKADNIESYRNADQRRRRGQVRLRQTCALYCAMSTTKSYSLKTLAHGGKTVEVEKAKARAITSEP